MHQNLLGADQQSIVIQVFGDDATNTTQESLLHQTLQQEQQQKQTSLPSNSSSSIKFNFSAMKLFHRFRKILMRLVFSSVPSPCPPPSSRAGGRSTDSRINKNNCDRFDPPKTSCSSYYSSHSHYNEAIADCIEFFNKSAQDGILDGRKSDVV